MRSSLPSRSVEATLDGVRVTYHFNNINLLDDPIFQGASMAKIEGFWPNNEVGEPSFLSRWDTFVVPDKNATVALVDSSYIEYSLMLSPARPVLSNNSYETYSRENVKPIKAYVGYLPSSIIAATRHNSYKNQDLLEVCVCPIHYDAEKKKVKGSEQQRRAAKKNTFNDFEQREYSADDISKMEQILMNRQG